MKKNLFPFLLSAFLFLGFTMVSSRAHAAPVIDGWTADPGPSLITDGDDSILHLQAHNDGLYITCDISSPTGDPIIGRVDTFGSTGIFLQNGGSGIYRFYRVVGVAPATLNEWVRVRPSGGATGQAHYSVTCRGGLNGTGATAVNAPQDVLVRVEGRVIEVYSDGLDHQWAYDNAFLGDYACDSGAYMESTKVLRNCTYSYTPTPLISAASAIPPVEALTYPAAQSGRRASLQLYGFYKGNTATISFSCDGLYRKVNGSVTVLMCPSPPPPPPTSPTLNLTVRGNANGVTASNGGTITIPNGTSATLSWTTTNATSCVATSPSGVNWNPTNATSSPGISTGNLTTGSYVYSLRCNGSSGTVPITQTVSVNVGTSLADPTLSYVCNPAGNSVTLSWNAIPTAMHYALRVDDLTNSPSWSGTCSSVNAGDTCDDYVTATTFTRPVTPNQNYDAWIHACPAVGSCSPGKHIAPTPFKCIPTPVTISGRIYNQTTGIGYGAASGVKIAACGSNPGTVVNADGTYSFQVPVGPAFCIRLTDASGNPFVPTGASGPPKTVFTDPVRSWVSSYEHQVGGQDCTTGSHCGDPVTSPDDGPSLWDRAVDTGYDFVYTSIPAPTATLDINPSAINIHPTANQKATLTWGSSGNVTSCSGTNFNTGGAISGTIQNLQPGSTTTYTVLCTGPGGNSLPVSKTLTVISVCNPDSTCGGTRSNVCTDKTCTDVCGNHYDGTKDCREFWKEVAP